MLSKFIFLGGNFFDGNITEEYEKYQILYLLISVLCEK